MPELRIKFVYRHGDADDGQLNLYDGAKSLEGIARALTIAVHAFANGEVRTRAEAAHNAELYIRSPQRGSFIYEAVIFFGGTVVSGVFYDFIKHTFNEAVGRILDEPQGRALQARIEPTIGELPAVLESALVDVHRPLMRAPEMTLTVTRPRGEELVTFTNATGQTLQPHEIGVPDPIIGHVTRYNTISSWGRLYDLSERRVISFLLSPELTEMARSLVTWSLHENNMGRDAKLYMRGTALVSPLQQRIKRYHISQVSDQPI